MVREVQQSGLGSGIRSGFRDQVWVPGGHGSSVRKANVGTSTIPAESLVHSQRSVAALPYLDEEHPLGEIGNLEATNGGGSRFNPRPRTVLG